MEKKEKHFDFKYKVNLYKGYFEKGYMLTNYVKYIIALFGLSSLNISATLILGFTYGIACFFLGWAWYKWGWINAEMEVGNRFNEFVKEMRNSKIFKETTP